MYVIPLVLTEEAAMELPDEMLSALVTCSTKAVKEKVKGYLENPEAKPGVKAKVGSAYDDVFKRDAYFADEALVANVQKVDTLEYGDIQYSLPLQAMEEYAEVLEGVLQSQYASPYLSPIEGSIIKKLKAEVGAYASEVQSKALRELARNLEDYSSLFRDSKSEKHVGTPVKRVMLNYRKFEVILHGLKFLIGRKQAGADPRSWRLI